MLLGFPRLVFRASGCPGDVASGVANQPGALFVTEYRASQQTHREPPGCRDCSILSTNANR